MKYFLGLTLGAIIGLSSCTFVKDFGTKYKHHLNKRFEQDSEKGKLTHVLELSSISRIYEKVDESSFSRYEDYEKLREGIKDDLGHVAGKALKKTTDEYEIIRKIKKLFKIEAKYGYKKHRKRQKKLLKDIDPEHRRDTWPFIPERFRFKFGGKLSTSFGDYFDEPIDEAINPELYIKLMDMYTFSWCPVDNEFKQKIKLRYGKVEASLYHKIKNDCKTQKVGIGLNYPISKRCILNLNLESYIKKADDHPDTFVALLSIKF